MLFFVDLKIGYPCPDTMELTPSGNGRTLMSAECRCPPGTAQHRDSTYCHKLYDRGPCDIAQYFAPMHDPNNIAIM